MLQAQTLLRGSIEGQGLHQVSMAAGQVSAAAYGTSWPASKSICCEGQSPGPVRDWSPHFGCCLTQSGAGSSACTSCSALVPLSCSLAAHASVTPSLGFPLQQYLQQQQQPLGPPYPQVSGGLGPTQSPQQPMAPPGEGRWSAVVCCAWHPYAGYWCHTSLWISLGDWPSWQTARVMLPVVLASTLSTVLLLVLGCELAICSCALMHGAGSPACRSAGCK